MGKSNPALLSTERRDLAESPLRKALTKFTPELTVERPVSE